MKNRLMSASCVGLLVLSACGPKDQGPTRTPDRRTTPSSTNDFPPSKPTDVPGAFPGGKVADVNIPPNVNYEPVKPDPVTPEKPKRPGSTLKEPTPATNPRLRFAMCSDGLPSDKTAMWKCDPIFADVNGDGHLDLGANPRLGKGPRVWFGNGKGNWKEASSGLAFGTSSCGGGLAFADFNKDGKLDLAVGDHCQGLYVFLGDGDGHWQMVTKALYPVDLMADGKGGAEEFAGIEDMDVGDINNDGNIDIVTVASDTGGVNVYLGNGTGTDWERATATDLAEMEWANRVVVSDVNKDGKADIVASYSQGPRVWHGDGTGRFTSMSQGLPSPMMKGLYQGLTVADFNSDSRPDIAVSNWIDGPQLFLQQTDGSWREGSIVFPRMTGGAYGMAAGDLDRDGHLDMVVSGRLDKDPGYVRGVFPLLGDGQGNFTYAEGTGLLDTGMSFNFGVAMADVNEDKFPDVVVGSGGTVESAPGRGAAIVAEKLVLWCSQPMGATSTAKK